MTRPVRVITVPPAETWGFRATCKCGARFVAEGRTAGAEEVSHFCRQVGSVVSCTECGTVGRIDVTLTLFEGGKRKLPS